MKLSETEKGARVTITAIPDSGVRSQAYRFGIGEGETVTCLGSIRKGPVILEKDLQEIALGRGIAEGISVAPAESAV